MEMIDQEMAIILIVDDKVGNITALKSLLENSDRRFLQATNGVEGLKIAINNNIDLIILDVQMPGMDGFEVAEILRSNKRTKDVPIIFASAEKTEQKAILKGFEEGAVDYLSKPLNPEITKAKVAGLLKMRHQQKELIRKNISLEKSELLINNSADIIGIIDTSTMCIEAMNHAFTSILGYGEKEVSGASILLFLCDSDQSKIQKLSASGKERLSFETQVYTKNRNLKWLQWNVVAKDGKWFINARDITEVKEVEKIRYHLTIVVKQSSDAIYLHNQEGKIISWNDGAERIYGYREEEALRMKVWNIVPEFIQPHTNEVFDRILQGERIQSLETKRITKHGNFVDVLFSASLVTDPNSSQKAIAITERDITHEKMAEAQITQLNFDLRKNILQLEDANKELESFSYSVSHDLRAPLRAVNGNARILQEDYSHVLDEAANLIIRKIDNNVIKMGRLIEDLLAFSKIGKKEVHKTKVSMYDLVQDIITDFGTAPAFEISVDPLPEAFADSSLVRQVWVNLISNAVKYSGKKEKPKIVIGFIQSSAGITYFVRDNGAGFDMRYADKLFGTFQRLHGADEFEGTGIGLAIVKRIVSKHGGSIWAESKVDEGACFYFTIPQNQ
jgi:PAS domain S-box-containing protein